MVWFFEGSAINPDYLTSEEKKLDSIKQIMAYRPDVVLAPANSIPSFLPGLKVAIFHGFDPGKLDSRGQNDHFKIRGCFDLYCTQGPNTTRPFKALQKKHGYFNVIETGWSALDPLFDKTLSPITSSKPVILLCSTFSKKLSGARQLLPVVAKISLSSHWQWLIQFHPKMGTEVINQYKAIQSENLRYIETDDILPLLKQADVMVSDTSSVIAMFLVQKKPVVTYNNIDPGPHLLDIDDPELLKNTIDQALSHPKPLTLGIQQFIEETHPYKDGLSSHRVAAAIDDVLTGKYPVKHKKPINLIRNLKFRKRLKYWKP